MTEKTEIKGYIYIYIKLTGEKRELKRGREREIEKAKSN